MVEALAISTRFNGRPVQASALAAPGPLRHRRDGRTSRKIGREATDNG